MTLQRKSCLLFLIHSKISVFISGFSTAFENWRLERYANTHFVDCSRKDSKEVWNDFTFSDYKECIYLSR